MLSFLAAIAVTFLSGALLLFLGISHVEALMAAVCIGYGIMLLWDVVLLYEYFPQSDISAFLFLRWADEFLPLAVTGLCINLYRIFCADTKNVLIHETDLLGILEANIFRSWAYR